MDDNNTRRGVANLLHTLAAHITSGSIDGVHVEWVYPEKIVDCGVIPAKVLPSIILQMEAGQESDPSLTSTFAPHVSKKLLN